jgi:hypothetical protein
MEEFIKKVAQLNELIKAIKTIKANPIKGPTLPTIPAPKAPPTPSLTPSAASAPKIGTGAGPDSKKDPKKVAQQIKDGSMSTKTQKVMLKVEHNGQWNLIEKADKPINPKDSVLNHGTVAPKPLSPEKLKEQQLKLDSYLKNKSLKKEEVESSNEEEKA